MAAVLKQLKRINASLSIVDDDKGDFDIAYCALQEGRFSYREFQQLLLDRSRTEFGRIWSDYRCCMLALVKAYRQADEATREQLRNELTRS